MGPRVLFLQPDLEPRFCPHAEVALQSLHHAYVLDQQVRLVRGYTYRLIRRPDRVLLYLQGMRLSRLP